MKILVIPLNSIVKFRFFKLLEKEEKDENIIWNTFLYDELEIGSLVFFAEVNKLVRTYKVIKINDNSIYLSKSLGEIYWKNWTYFANSKKNYLWDFEHILDEEKSKPIYEILK